MQKGEISINERKQKYFAAISDEYISLMAGNPRIAQMHADVNACVF